MPSQTFNTIQQLLNYINGVWVTNGVNGITGDEGNVIFNAIVKFIQSYTVNNSLAQISSTTSQVVVLPAPITVFTAPPISLQWDDNVQNEYYIVNSTGVALQITAGFYYVDLFGVAQTEIPLRSSIHIAKATNGSWVQINNLPGTSSGSTDIKFVYFQFKIGDVDSPMVAGDTVLPISQANIIDQSIFITLAGPELPQSDNAQISYIPTYGTDESSVAFNNPVSNGQLYIVHYAYLGSGNIPVPSGFASGKSTQSGTGVQLQFRIPHGLGVTPTWINVEAGSSDAVGLNTTTLPDSIYIYVNFGVAPPLLSGNLLFYWAARR